MVFQKTALWNTPKRLPVHFRVVIDIADFSQLELHKLFRIQCCNIESRIHIQLNYRYVLCFKDQKYDRDHKLERNGSSIIWGVGNHVSYTDQSRSKRQMIDGKKGLPVFGLHSWGISRAASAAPGSAFICINNQHQIPHEWRRLAPRLPAILLSFQQNICPETDFNVRKIMWSILRISPTERDTAPINDQHNYSKATASFTQTIKTLRRRCKD